MQYTTNSDILEAIKDFENRVSSENIKGSLVKDSTIHNLYLHLVACKNSISKTFIFRYTFNYKIYSITLGKLESMTLQDARRIASKYNEILHSMDFKHSGLDLKSFIMCNNQSDIPISINISDLKIKTIIGILDYERESVQTLIVNACIKYVFNKDDGVYLDYMLLVSFIKNRLTKGEYGLLEEAISDVSKELFNEFSCISSIFLEIKKPDVSDEFTIFLSAKFEKSQSICAMD